MTKPEATSRGGEQRGRPVPHVVERPPLGYARHHRQDWLFAIEGLDLALLVDAENKRPVGRREIKADDIAHLVDEQRIVRQLECLATVRLLAERRPHPAHRGVRKAGLLYLEPADQIGRAFDMTAPGCRALQRQEGLGQMHECLRLLPKTGDETSNIPPWRRSASASRLGAPVSR